VVAKVGEADDGNKVGLHVIGVADGIFETDGILEEGFTVKVGIRDGLAVVGDVEGADVLVKVQISFA